MVVKNQTKKYYTETKEAIHNLLKPHVPDWDDNDVVEYFGDDIEFGDATNYLLILRKVE